MKNSFSGTTIYDISPSLSPRLAVWPGDQPVVFEANWVLGHNGSPVNVSKFTMSTHSGSHADAPSHYLADGAGAETLPLERYWGPARLIRVRASERGLIEPEALEGQLKNTPERVLLCSVWHSSDERQWHPDFAAMAPDSLSLLASHGVKLIGLDTPSLDPEQAKELHAHLRLAALNMSVIESLVLSHVPPGDYELSALPLKLLGLDAAPLRAALRTLP